MRVLTGRIFSASVGVSLESFACSLHDKSAGGYVLSRVTGEENN